MSIQRYSAESMFSISEDDLGSFVGYDDHQAEVAELTKRLEAAELNAARYEWIRKCGNTLYKLPCFSLSYEVIPEALDEAVDANRLAQGESNGD